MDYSKYLQTASVQFQKGIQKHISAYQFIQKYQLWTGMDRYGWLSKLLIAVAVIFGLMFLNIVVEWWDKSDASSIYAASQSMGLLASDLFNEGFKPIFTSGSNFFLLALVEVLVYHFSRRTIEVLTGRDSPTKFKDFLDAQKRMIKVMFFAWGILIAVKALLGIAFGIFGFLSFLKSPILFGAEILMLGFAILDNYNEQFGLTIKESFNYMQNYAGLCLAVGVVVYVLLLIPVLGPIVAPIITAVAGSLAMYELSDLHKQRVKVNPEDLVVD